MTQPETIQLSIEFERRLLTISPGFTITNKPDTQTIQSFLNEAQDTLFQKYYAMYLQQNKTPDVVKLAEELLVNFIETFLQSISDDTTSPQRITIPELFYHYIDSFTTVKSSYNKNRTNSPKDVKNIFVNKNEETRLFDEIFDEKRIMRRPVVMMGSNNQFELYFDNYTKPESFTLTYYKKPTQIDLLANTVVPSDFPYSFFDELVQTAVQLYISYATGANNKRELQPKQQEQNTEQQ